MPASRTIRSSPSPPKIPNSTPTAKPPRCRHIACSCCVASFRITSNSKARPSRSMRYAPRAKPIPSSSTRCTATANNAARASPRRSIEAESQPLEDGTDLLGFVCADRNRLRGGPQLLVPRFNGVSAGRQTAQIESAVLPGHRKERVLEHRAVTVHPGVQIALHRNCDLFPGKRFVHAGTRRLGLVPFAIVRRRGMDVVRRGVVVHHVQRLIRPHRQYVRHVHAALLLDDHGLRGSIESSISQAFRNKHNHVLQVAFRVRHHLLREYRRRVLPGAARICRHADQFGLWDHTFEPNDALHMGGTIRRCGRRGSGGVHHADAHRQQEPKRNSDSNYKGQVLRGHDRFLNAGFCFCTTCFPSPPFSGGPYWIDGAGAALGRIAARDSSYPRRYPAANMKRSWAMDQRPIAGRAGWPCSPASFPRYIPSRKAPSLARSASEFAAGPMARLLFESIAVVPRQTATANTQVKSLLIFFSSASFRWPGQLPDEAAPRPGR